MEVCLPTTCHLLGISCHMGQAIRASFMHKEEIATQVLAKGCENVKVSRNYYNYFGKRIIHVVPEQKKAKKLIVHKLGGVIVKLSHMAMEAALDIGLLHKPKMVHNVTFGGTNICFGSPCDMNKWNGLTKYKKHYPLRDTIMENCKFNTMDCKMSYLWSELVTDNNPQVPYTYFDPAAVLAS